MLLKLKLLMIYKVQQLITELQTLTGGHPGQIEANTGAIIELTAQTEAYTAAIAATITATAVDDIVTGLVNTIDSKVPSSYLVLVMLVYMEF